ncbi:MAG TPA: exosortase B [Burkholderiales bacterium]|nr:exosortase B [Burkholderiales bacterium]
MSATFPRPGVAWLPWVPVGLGLLALYVPVFYEFANGLWQSDDHAHGPIILAVIVWLFWRQKDAFLLHTPPALGWGIGLLVFGLLLYVVGRSQDITIFEAGALAPILAGALLAMRGWSGLRAFWFPILFVAFLVPLPGIFVDALTGPLKREVSEIAEQLLYLAGYPVARNGVMLTVGQYQLLVADACSGLNSMFSLSALGLLYLYIVQHKSWLHNGLMIASILPIAFVANIVRVLALVLVTYHFGDEAGQGFLHGAAGIVLLLVALTFILSLDAVLARVIKPRKAA